MKVCYIGNCGHSKQAHAVLKKREGVELCGIAPGSEYEDEAKLLKLGVPLYPSYEEMLDELRPDLAVVSPVFGKTGEVIRACAARGIDVFSEKPVATTLEELDEVEKAVRTAGIRFSAMHFLRFRPSFYTAAQMVKSGAIGEVRLLTAQKSYKYGTRPAWYFDRALYGGTIPWVGIHAIDWVYAFSGKKFLSVTARSFGSPETHALCQFELEGGAMASVNLDYYRPAAAPTHDDDRIRCAGTDGVIEVIRDRITLIDKDGERDVTPTEAPDLFACFLDGQDVISQDEIFYLTRVALCARDAADSGEKIQICKAEV
ncbi:MAG: Gfo/Idh/MocA family oxidoreductase [Clostridia bacterium]|nr:Gfo/Idh/MocA family oxidoreductase [Clostridia bacterium]